MSPESEVSFLTHDLNTALGGLMMKYLDDTAIRVGDHVRHGNADAVVEAIIEGDDVASWDIEAPGFLILRDQCGRVLIDPGSFEWEEVVFVGRGA